MRGEPMVPAAPFVRLLREYLDRFDEEKAAHESAAHDLGVTTRRTSQYLHYEDEMPFPIADKIVTRLVGAMAWHEDDELAEIYQSVNLRRFDILFPIDSPGALAWAHEQLVAAFDSHETKRGAGLSLGLDERTFSHRLDAALKALGRESDVAQRIAVCWSGHNTARAGTTKWGECRACYEEKKEARNAAKRAARAAQRVAA